MLIEYSMAKYYGEDVTEQWIKSVTMCAGPNQVEGWRKVKAASDKLGLGLTTYGSETHVAAVIPTALDISDPLPEPDPSTSLGPPARELGDHSPPEFVGDSDP